MSKAPLLLVFVLLYGLFTACVERYYPHEDNLKTGTLVINAHLTDPPGYQQIEISRSVALIYPLPDPVSGCFAQLIREDGELRPVPEIDSLYYEVESASFQTKGDSTDGVRFYIDFTYNDEEYEFIRWDVTETYEFHNPAMEGFIWDVDFKVKPLPDTSNYRICYITNPLHEIHSMSLDYLDYRAYKNSTHIIPDFW